MTWREVKKAFNFYNNACKSWMHRYMQLDNIFDEEILKVYLNDEDLRVQQKAKEKLEMLSKYKLRKDFDNVISIKLVMPTTCNANCKFCYNNKNRVSLDKSTNFIVNFKENLLNLIAKLGDKPLSLDITGGEPTFDLDLLNSVMNELLPIKHKFKRIVLTTNGYHLDKAINIISNVVDYVNISTHHYIKDERDKIFAINNLTDTEYKSLVLKLLDVGIYTSTTAVIDKVDEDFESFIQTYIAWCNVIGFQSLRIRNNVFNRDNGFNEAVEKIKAKANRVHDRKYISEYNLIRDEDNPDSKWCMLNSHGIFLYFLNGIEDTSAKSPGIEYIVHDDGEIYLNFAKTIKLNSSPTPLGLVFDKIEEEENE